MNQKISSSGSKVLRNNSAFQLACMCVCTYLDILVCVWNGRGYCTEKLLKEVFINATFIDHNNIRNLGTTTSQIFLYQVNDFF